MNDFTHHHSGILERSDRDVPFVAEIRWAWNAGETPEPGSDRTVGRGWDCEWIKVWEDRRGGPALHLTEVEERCLLEDCHPDALESVNLLVDDWRRLYPTEDCDV